MASLGFLLIVLGGREKILAVGSPFTPAWHLAVVYFGVFLGILYQKSFGILKAHFVPGFENKK